MARRLSLAFVLALSVLFVHEASASTIFITGTDYTGFPLGTKILGPDGDPEGFRNPANENIGELTNKVFAYDPGLDGIVDYYTYVHDVDPVLNNNSFFQTAFTVSGFAGIAGWRFSDTTAGPSPDGTGTNADFEILLQDGFLSWRTIFGTAGNWWDAGEDIRFFYTSFNPPADELKDYSLTGSGTLPGGPVGTAQSYAPTPEPGSMLLLGSGLATVYGAARRRRNQKGSTTPVE